MSDFTPGPWKYCKWAGLTGHDGRRILVDGVSLPMGIHSRLDEAFANSRLIAQSPAMYTLLREFGGHGGDGFCEACGRDIASGAEHGASCRINAILKAVEGQGE